MALFKETHILVLDEDVFMGKLLNKILTSFEVGQITLVKDLAQAGYYLEKIKIDLFITDWIEPKKPCLAALEYVRQSSAVQDSSIPVIIYTGRTTISDILKARDRGASDIISKPVVPANVFDKVVSSIFSDRQFINVDGYTGPDRRRHDTDYAGVERRNNKKLSEGEIDQLLQEERNG
jgi:two-component system, chemotaxis family, chemotaxis protein CheY